MSFFSMLGRPDPTAWLLASDEPAARWVALTRLAEAPAGAPEAPAAQTKARAAKMETLAPEARAARTAVVRDPATQILLSLLPDLESDPVVSGHDRPLLATNLLDLLYEMGVRAEDDPRVGRLLDQFLAHTDEDGRFQTFAAAAGAAGPRWGALLCDTHPTIDMLLAYGRGSDPRVCRALATSLTDLRATEQGPAWPCRPSTGDRWRGPGRARDCCPQTTLEALRAFSRLPVGERPPEIAAAAGTVLGVWRSRGSHKPYMFGHGRQFKQVKWPPTWYGSYEVVDTLGRLPEVWDGAGSRAEDRAALAEVAACLLAYNVAPDATVTPLSTFKGFETFSFGQKKVPSPLATALVWAALKRLETLEPEIAAVDIGALASSKGGTGVPLPPRLKR